jgi:hypothetical protein
MMTNGQIPTAAKPIAGLLRTRIISAPNGGRATGVLVNGATTPVPDKEKGPPFGSPFLFAKLRLISQQMTG